MNYSIYSVLFKNSSKPYYFKTTLELEINDEVIVETEKGNQYGKVVGKSDSFDETVEYKEIIRKASEEDTKKYYKNLKDASLAAIKCKELVKDLGLEMNVINAAFNFDRSQLLINFRADERVDFRELAKALAAIYKTRIELRQIGARDKAKEVGGVGVCGQKLCCSRFLNQIDSISMNKAKNQGLALNPSKINGLCGRLLCCLCYEDDMYLECQKGLKKVGMTITLDDGSEGQIINVDVLNRKYTVLVNDEKIEVYEKEYHDNRKK